MGLCSQGVWDGQGGDRAVDVGAVIVGDQLAQAGRPVAVALQEEGADAVGGLGCFDLLEHGWSALAQIKA